MGEAKNYTQAVKSPPPFFLLRSKCRRRRRRAEAKPGWGRHLCRRRRSLPRASAQRPPRRRDRIKNGGLLLELFLPREEELFLWESVLNTRKEVKEKEDRVRSGEREKKRGEDAEEAVCV